MNGVDAIAWAAVGLIALSLILLVIALAVAAPWIMRHRAEMRRMEREHREFSERIQRRIDAGARPTRERFKL